jgi:hypothetical protein
MLAIHELAWREIVEHLQPRHLTPQLVSLQNALSSGRVWSVAGAGREQYQADDAVAQPASALR